MHTIAAISSPAGTGAIAVIRLSGDDAIAIVCRLFMPHNKRRTLDIAPVQSAIYGTIVDPYTDEVIDEVIATVFRAPHSFTTEDMVEISCHGSLFIQNAILKLLIDNGARMATAGEFTKRAFINGRLDLTQAEAVADVIGARSAAAHALAIRQLKGDVSSRLTELRGKLVHLASLIELELDFSDHEDVEFADRTELLAIANDTRQEISRLCNSFAQGNAIKNGIPVAIVGEPNVGKSTLLNRLVGDDAAIVSDIAGTTRDSIERETIISGTLFRIIDTAGIHDTNDTIEKLGIERSLKAIKNAQIVLHITIPATHNTNQHYSQKNHIIVINKIDTAPAGYKVPENAIAISAKNGDNIDTLISAMTSAVSQPIEDVTITNARHYEVLSRALESIIRVIEGLEQNIPSDLVAQDLRECTSLLAEVTGGEITPDEVLGNIFSKFCIGK